MLIHSGNIKSDSRSFVVCCSSSAYLAIINLESDFMNGTNILIMRPWELRASYATYHTYAECMSVCAGRKRSFDSIEIVLFRFIRWLEVVRGWAHSIRQPPHTIPTMWLNYHYYMINSHKNINLLLFGMCDGGIDASHYKYISMLTILFYLYDKCDWITALLRTHRSQRAPKPPLTWYKQFRVTHVSHVKATRFIVSKNAL